MADSVATRVSSLLVDELRDAAERGEFGVVVRDVKPLDYELLASAAGPLASKRGPQLRMALVGQKEIVARLLPAAGKTRFVSSREEDAVQWRNERLRTIAVITERPLTKAASLRDFRDIKEADLTRRLCAREAAQA